MSLINDVLRQVDNRSKAQGDGLSFGYVGHEGERVRSGNKKIHYWLLAVIVGVAAFLITNNLSLFISSKPEVSSFKTSMVNDGSSFEDNAFVMDEDEEIDDFDEALLLLDIEEGIEESNVEYIEPAKVETLNIFKKNEEKSIEPVKEIKSIASVDPKKAIKKVADEPRQQKTVKKTRNTGIDEYNKALAHFNRSEYSQAIHWSNQAILESKKEAYFQLLLRSYLASRNKPKFISVASDNDYASYSWLSIKASGMHLFDEHQEAIEAFKALIAKGNNTEKWKIALALSYESVGEIDNARTVYKNLLDIHLLSDGQKKQIKNKLTQLSAKEKRHGS